MTKYITVKLTEDQAEHLLSILRVEMLELEKEDVLQTSIDIQAAHAFAARLIGKINAELVKL